MTEQEWIEKGCNPWVAEALEGREVSPEIIMALSVEDILNEVFEWHGFVGFTRLIIDAVDNVRKMEADL